MSNIMILSQIILVSDNYFTFIDLKRGYNYVV